MMAAAVRLRDFKRIVRGKHKLSKLIRNKTWREIFLEISPCCYTFLVVGFLKFWYPIIKSKHNLLPITIHLGLGYNKQSLYLGQSQSQPDNRKQTEQQ